MATQTMTTYYSLLGLHGITGEVAETIFEKNPIVRDAPIFPGNEKMGHKGSRTTSLPAPTFRKVGGYTTPGTATWTPYTEDISIVDGASVVPKDVLRIEGASKLVYLERAHREGFVQSIAGHWFNGSVATAPEKYKSFNERYQTPDNGDSTYSPESPDPSTAADPNVYDGGGTGSDTFSVWFFRWGPEQVHLISPANDPQQGITEVDEGIQKQWSTSTFRNVYVKTWEWWHGICIANLKTVARLRNNESSLDTVSNTLILNMMRVINEGIEGTGPVWIYVPPRAMTMFQWLATNKQNVTYERDNPWGRPLFMFQGEHPIQSCQKLGLAEAAVAAV